MVDNIRGGADAVQHLIDLGHDRIGLVCGPHTTSSGLQRYQGYCQALELNGLQYVDALVAEGNFTYEGGYTCMQRILAQQPLPTAIFATSDVMALGAKKAIEDFGLCIPAELSLIGFDDIPRVSMVDPKLTTIAQPRYQMGWESARLLIDRIEQSTPPTRRKVVMEHKLVVRGSTTAI
jgi:DNA-binding LacI/PurR family transcriptional regulator